MKAVVAWSGGKDSCYAYYKALKEGHEVVSFLVFMHSERTSNFHALSSGFLSAQADAIRVSLSKHVTSPELYEKQFKDVLLHYKSKGVEGLITGDICEVVGHEAGWLERVSGEVGLLPIRPLWLWNTRKIFEDFVSDGFKATVVRTRLDVLGEEWLGRELDMSFLRDISKVPNVDACGEGGEYHTVVTDGPVFQEQIRLLETQKLIRDGYGHLKILRFKKMRK